MRVTADAAATLCQASGNWPAVWRGNRPEAVLDLIHGGAVRAAMVIDAQAAEDRARIHETILEAVRARRVADGGYLLRRPAVLAAGRRPLPEP